MVTNKWKLQWYPCSGSWYSGVLHHKLCQGGIFASDSTNIRKLVLLILYKHVVISDYNYFYLHWEWEWEWNRGSLTWCLVLRMPPFCFPLSSFFHMTFHSEKQCMVHLHINWNIDTIFAGWRGWVSCRSLSGKQKICTWKYVTSYTYKILTKEYVECFWNLFVNRPKWLCKFT